MSIYNYNGDIINLPYQINGLVLHKAYNFSGKTIWKDSYKQDFIYSGPKSPWVEWKFKKVSDTSNTSYSSTSESKPSFDDSSWEAVTIPHDWSIRNDFNSKSAASYSGGYLDGGDAWYRCKFIVSESMITNHTLIYFDGIYMESTIYINGIKVGSNNFGYDPFTVDISNYINIGENTLAIFVRNQQPSSRWYSGSGIFRPVYLLCMEGAKKWISNVQVTYPDLKTEKDSKVTTLVSFNINNLDTNTSAQLKINISDSENKIISEYTENINIANGENILTKSVLVETPKLWDIGSPNLYYVNISISGDFGSYITDQIPFGYRWTEWDVDTGFWINGNNVKLKGVCMHHDLGCIGAEVNKSAIERQVGILISMGCNAIRLTHNPSSAEFLNVCRDKGILAIEELFDSWTVAKSTYDFHRYFNDNYASVIKNTLLRDRNNPAIIMWSVGNEINRVSNYSASTASSIITNILTEAKKYDTTRPYTMGEDRPNLESSKACMNLLDVCGINYNSNSLIVPHDLGKPSYGSETTSALSSRGIYSRDNTNLQCSSLDNDKVDWGNYAADSLKSHMENAYSGGMFVWTGFDYIGEPTPFNKYPAKSSYFGIIDTAGFPKDIYYMYQSQWTTNPMIHVFPRNLDSISEGSTTKLYAYSNCESIELFINGTSLGKKTKSDIGEKYQYIWETKFQKGTITAKGYDSEGNVIATDEIKTSSGTPSKLLLTAYNDSVDITTNDLAFITCEVLDENGIIVPNASNTITFTIKGGSILGTDNGNAACVENMRKPIRSAFSGKCLCVASHDKKEGSMIITASSDGLESNSITINKK